MSWESSCVCVGTRLSCPFPPRSLVCRYSAPPRSAFVLFSVLASPLPENRHVVCCQLDTEPRLSDATGVKSSQTWECEMLTSVIRTCNYMWFTTFRCRTGQMFPQGFIKIENVFNNVMFCFYGMRKYHYFHKDMMTKVIRVNIKALSNPFMTVVNGCHMEKMTFQLYHELE